MQHDGDMVHSWGEGVNDEVTTASGSEQLQFLW